MADKLSKDQIDEGLQSRTHWSLEDGKLHREFKFRNFIEAFGFMTQAAIAAEKMNHHPEWFNVYNKVIVDLQTHDADGITELDFTLAARMDRIAGD